jgi:hypothetical protein
MVISKWLYQNGYIKMVISKWLYQNGYIKMVISFTSVIMDAFFLIWLLVLIDAFFILRKSGK